MKDRLRKNYVFRIIIDDVSKHAVDLPNLCHYNLGDILKKSWNLHFFQSKQETTLVFCISFVP